MVSEEGGFISEEDIALYIPEESMRSEAIVASYENRAMRLNALYKILKERPRFIITTAYGMIRHLPKKELMTSLIIDLKVGDRYSLPVPWSPWFRLPNVINESVHLSHHAGS